LLESILQSFSLITGIWLCNFFWCKEIDSKAACKMLVKLITDVDRLISPTFYLQLLWA